MTKTTMHMTLASHGAEFRLGPGEEADITAVTGLESSEYDIGLSDLAAVPGSSLDGIHVKARPIHIEGSFRSSGDTEADREKLIRFFMPDRDGVLTVRVGKRTRSIGYNVEGWTLKARRNLDVRVGFIIDLICPDPYLPAASLSSSSSTRLRRWFTTTGTPTPGSWQLLSCLIMCPPCRLTSLS